MESLKEFKDFTIYNQNASKNLDNSYIESLFALTTHEANFKRLLVPNSAEEAKGLSSEIRELLGKEKIDYSSPGNMLKRKFMSELRQAFVSAKHAIGISAVAQTNHAQNQRTGIFLDETKLKNLSYQDALYLTDTRINFKEFNTLNSRVSLSGIKSADGGNYISDVIGQFIDGYVDISKGPWIMELGATSNVAGLWLFLLKAGVPFRDVAYFLNQPIIRDYLKELDSSGISTLFSKPVIERISDNYFTKSKMEISIIPEADVLRKMIGNKNLDANQKAQQQYIFSEFLKYAKMGQQLLTYVQGSNFDTANFNDPLLVGKKELQLEAAKKSIISSVEDNLEASFVGNLFDKVQNARNAFSDLLVSDATSGNGRTKGPREVIAEVLKPYVTPYINDKKFVKLGRKVVENLFDFVMQTGSMLNVSLSQSFFDSIKGESTVKDIIAYRDKVLRNLNHPLHDNLVLNNLQLDPTGRAEQLDSVYIKAKSNKVFNQNLIINSFRELREYLENENSDLFDRFMRLAILQSGLTNSYISFTSLLPYEEFGL